jgi:hypothetical protein
MVEKTKQPTKQEILELIRETGFIYTQNLRLALIGV